MNLPEHLMPKFDYETPEEMMKHFEEAEDYILKNGTWQEVQDIKVARKGIDAFIETLKRNVEEFGHDINVSFRTTLNIMYHIDQTAKANNCPFKQVSHEFMIAVDNRDRNGIHEKR